MRRRSDENPRSGSSLVYLFSREPLRFVVAHSLPQHLATLNLSRQFKSENNLTDEMLLKAATAAIDISEVVV
jgi:hypothetical protein